MGLSTRKPTKAGQEIGKKMIETATRISYLSDDEMKQLKIKSITASTDIKGLIDSALKEIMGSKKYQFKTINVNTKKRSFTISQERLKEMQIFLLDCDGITQDKLIYNAVLKIIQ